MASVAIDNVRLYREAQEQIAETKRAQEMLERGKESMQLAQQYVGIGIWEWDLQTGELAWSDEIRRLHGIEVEKFDGRYESWMESIVPEDRQHVHQSITEALASKGEYEVQYRVIFADKGLHWLEARGRTIVIGGRAGPHPRRGHGRDLAQSGGADAAPVREGRRHRTPGGQHRA